MTVELPVIILVVCAFAALWYMIVQRVKDEINGAD